MASFTKKAIRDSFVKLLNEKPLSQIWSYVKKKYKLNMPF